MSVETEHRTILVTGASGYVGGRLTLRLVDAGYHVRCMSRRPDGLRERHGDAIEAVGGDLLDRTAVSAALDSVDTAFYLVHSMGRAEDFAAEEADMATVFAEEARAAGVRRIVYLGGLGGDDADSPHLASRHRVGEILRDSGVSTVELRASVIIGSGSLSFEMIRSLVERLPVMVTPRWVSRKAQPIGIEDVLAYLTTSIELGDAHAGVFEIGGADQVSYADLLREYARQRGLLRLLIPVPVLTPHLSSLWLALVTPLYARVGRKLVDSIRHDTVVTDDGARRVFAIQPLGMREAINRALLNEDREFAETRWSDAVSSSGLPSTPYGGTSFGRRKVDSRSIHVPVAPAIAFGPIERIGGANGWYFGNLLWTIRGFLDLLVGGVGVRRGRRDPLTLVPGDTVDWWRVEDIQPGQRLLLRAEMRLPGRAWLQFEVDPAEDGSTVRQTALYDPVGLQGLLYWYALFPVHAVMFRGMLRRIRERAVRDGTVAAQAATASA
jgi:uncharacterized protein YbjT (DUF2867 family)